MPAGSRIGALGEELAVSVERRVSFERLPPQLLGAGVVAGSAQLGREELAQRGRVPVTVGEGGEAAPGPVERFALPADGGQLPGDLEVGVGRAQVVARMAIRSSASPPAWATPSIASRARNAVCEYGSFAFLVAFHFGSTIFR